MILLFAVAYSLLALVWTMDAKTIGFLGCGKISSAVCRGFATCATPPRKIFVSLRSIDKSEALKRDFPDLIEVLDDNNKIAELSDVLFIGLLPNVAEEVLPQLPLTPQKLIISMMAAVDYSKTLQLLSQIPADRIVRTVPLPSASRRSGPIIMFPGQSEAEEILRFVGTPIVCEEEAKMKPMISVTGHISSLYELMRTTQSFLSEKGVQEETALQFVKAFYSSLASGAEQSHDDLEELRDEAATKGGLNEQSVAFLRNSTHFELQRESLEQILARLTKK